ncbi:hypothetical protein ICN84_09425 [Akkermansia glycaniphila]|uniref:hypothetical protein n=1 Tax=Akkermansia glycaniphila TaxID=1679444 RepID=UPI001C03232D|nr:hypothetical protein [Akkermansia glycaniphila]MBT9450288.1 hypothetical protein [Akkermansia glycaniphila]
MQKKTIISAALAVASLAGIALAGSGKTVVVPNPTQPVAQPKVESRFSGTVQAGYKSNYDCRGIVASHSLVEGDSVIPVALDMSYSIAEKEALLFGISYDVLTSGHHLYGMDGASFHNEADIYAAYQQKDMGLKNLTATVGWNLNYGGLLGNYAKYGKDKAHSVTQEFFLNLNYDIGDHFFAGVTTSYGFQGVTGWWFQPYVGHKATLCERTDIVTTLGMSATASYFNSENWLGNANGSQAFFVKAELPTKLTENLSVVPFVSLNWLGNGSLKANKGVEDGSKPYKNFGVVAGANIVYNF